MKRLFASGLFAAALVTLPAFAQTPPPVPLPPWFVEIDIGKKGEVTRAEFLKYRMKSLIAVMLWRRRASICRRSAASRASKRCMIRRTSGSVTLLSRSVSY